MFSGRESRFHLAMFGELRNFSLICLLSLLPGLSYAKLPGLSRHREQPAGTFSIDVDEPFDKVVNAVRDVATDGVILGTFEYKDTQELPDAEAASPCPFFKPWTGQGEVLCKVRRKALSPAHFIGSNDIGTVAVRYVVQPLTSDRTRILIDSTFVEDARRGEHPSDGFVETSEFGLIQQHIHATERQAAEAQTQLPATSQERVEQVDSAKTGDLQHVIADQRAALEAANANLSQLQAQAEQLKASATVLIAAARAELKTLPYAHAATVEALEKGQEVTILTKSAYWWRVRSSDGREGWLYHSDLEGQP